jgi:hypothetical protein
MIYWIQVTPYKVLIWPEAYESQIHHVHMKTILLLSSSLLSSLSSSLSFFFTFEIYDLYAFKLSFISILSQFIWD